MLARDASELAGRDAELRTLLEDLTEGRITLASYLGYVGHPVRTTVAPHQAAPTSPRSAVTAPAPTWAVWLLGIGPSAVAGSVVSAAMTSSLIAARGGVPAGTGSSDLWFNFTQQFLLHVIAVGSIAGLAVAAWFIRAPLPNLLVGSIAALAAAAGSRFWFYTPTATRKADTEDARTSWQSAFSAAVRMAGVATLVLLIVGPPEYEIVVTFAASTMVGTVLGAVLSRFFSRVHAGTLAATAALCVMVGWAVSMTILVPDVGSDRELPILLATLIVTIIVGVVNQRWAPSSRATATP